MDRQTIIDLYKEFINGNRTKIQNTKKFCEGCQNNIENIPNDYSAFISIGDSPVAGIGYGTSELTKECQEKMKARWEKEYCPCLRELKNQVNEDNIKGLSDLVEKDRGHALNLFINRCIITLHNTELLAIANIGDLKLLFDLLVDIGIVNKTDYQKQDNIIMEWYNNNKILFTSLQSVLNNPIDIETLSCFGWYLKERLSQILSLKKTLENCYNIILTGAPGTGKTFMAKEIAKQMGAEFEFVQFHPSYDYTDFVEGLRPTNNSGKIVFKRKDGLFKSFCFKAVTSMQQNDPKKYVMIIDEINRGEISKIFGELFYSIDPDYRVKKSELPQSITKDNVKNYAIQTQYQNLIDVNNNKDCFRYGFFVPENLYIIGTMNDIDRSVESLDFAMRRRFTFVEFIASDHLGMFDKIKDEQTKELAKKKMKALNNAIVNPKVGKLSTAYQIGGSYFVNINRFNDSDNKWEDLWNYYLKGLIYEYYRGLPDADDVVDKLKKEYMNAKLP